VTRSHTLRRRLLVLAVSLLAWSIVTELLLRRFYPIGALYFQPDAQRYYKPLEGARTVNLPIPGSGAPQVVWSFNSQGFRGVELAPKSAGARRIAVYGDSFVHARETRLPETFVARLSDELAKDGRRAETVNAGVIGYGPDQSLLRFESEAEWLAPDVVVLAICTHNDFRELALTQLFRVGPDGALVEAYSTGDPGYVERHRAYVEKQERQKANTSSFALVRLVKHVLGLAPIGATPEATDTKLLANEIRDWRASSASFARAGAEPPPDPTTLVDAPPDKAGSIDLARKELALFTRVLARFRDGCAARKVPFVVVAIPCKFDLVDFASLDLGEPPADYRASTMTDTVARAAKELGIPCLDLYAPFRERGGSAMFLGGSDTHWSPAGQACAAGLLADFLVKQRSL
jgi:hypothetical protein